MFIYYITITTRLIMNKRVLTNDKAFAEKLSKNNYKGTMAK